MLQILLFVFQPIKHYILILAICALSVVNMLVLRVRGICLSSVAGEYISILVVIGMMMRVYIAGISQNNQDYTFADGDKAVYTLAANILIILGLTILSRNWTQCLISLVLVVDQCRRAMKVMNGFLILPGNKRPWNMVRGLTREWAVIALVSAMGILIDYITFKNGGPVPLKV